MKKLLLIFLLLPTLLFPQNIIDIQGYFKILGNDTVFFNNEELLNTIIGKFQSISAINGFEEIDILVYKIFNKSDPVFLIENYPVQFKEKANDVELVDNEIEVITIDFKKKELKFKIKKYKDDNVFGKPKDLKDKVKDKYDKIKEKEKP